MLDDSPAVAVPEAPTGAVTTPEAQPATEPAAATASPTATEAPQTPAKPDISSLLSDPELRKELRQKMLAEDEDLKLELHRARSEAGRRAKAEMDTLRAEIARYQEVLTADPTEVGEKAQQDAREAIERFKRSGEEQQQVDQWIASEFERANKIAKFSPEQAAKLYPGYFGSRAEWQAALSKATEEAIESRSREQAKTLAAEIAEELLKKRLPAEREALRQEILGEAREKQATVPGMPAGNGAVTDSDFLARFARGEITDWKRAMEVLKK